MRRIAEVFGLLSFATLLAWCVQPDPRAALYGAERLRCVADYDAAAEARACVRAVDRLYGQDGGR